MWYWIIMFMLAAGCVLMLTVSFKSIKRSKAELSRRPDGGRRSRQAEFDEDSAHAAAPGRKSGRPDTEQNRPQRRPQQKKRRQWKIILEDIDSWEKYSFTFYDTVGIGRGKDSNMYEKYLSVPKDGRVSKIHCAIVSRGDRLYLKDEESRNGTYLNGTRIERPEMIQRDDIIGLGETRLEIQRVLRESE